MGDEQHKLGTNESEGTPRGRGRGEGGGVPVGVAGVAQGTLEEESAVKAEVTTATRIRRRKPCPVEG